MAAAAAAKGGAGSARGDEQRILSSEDPYPADSYDCSSALFGPSREGQRVPTETAPTPASDHDTSSREGECEGEGTGAGVGVGVVGLRVAERFPVLAK
jgi:hypothetical protein